MLQQVLPMHTTHKHNWLSQLAHIIAMDPEERLPYVRRYELSDACFAVPGDAHTANRVLAIIN